MKTIQPWFILTVFALCGCKRQERIHEEGARAQVQFLTKTVESDVQELERGLPQGALRFRIFLASKTVVGHKLEELPQEVRRELGTIRRENVDLTIAKSTFFGLANETGVFVRSNLDSETLAGKNLFESAPDLRRSHHQPFVSCMATFDPLQRKEERYWLATSAVKDEQEVVRAYYVTGWSLRAYALRLQEALKSELASKARTTHTLDRIPVFYLGVFEGPNVVTAPQTPSVDDDALKKLNLSERTQGGPTSGVLTITQRLFGYAAERTPKLGANVGVAVLYSVP